MVSSLSSLPSVSSFFPSLSSVSLHAVLLIAASVSLSSSGFAHASSSAPLVSPPTNFTFLVQEGLGMWENNHTRAELFLTNVLAKEQRLVADFSLHLSLSLCSFALPCSPFARGKDRGGAISSAAHGRSQLLCIRPLACALTGRAGHCARDYEAGLRGCAEVNVDKCYMRRK